MVSPRGLAGAAVIGAFVLLQVAGPRAEAGIQQNIPLHVHRISNELIKCTCEGGFAARYFEINLWQACSTVSLLGHGLYFLFLPGAANVFPGVLKRARVCV